MPSIGAVVKRLRRRKGISQPRLQEMSGGKIKIGWLASLETDRIKNPPQDRLELLASYLGTSVLEIYKQAGIVVLPYPGDASPEEKHLIETYRSLSPEDRRRARRILDDLARAESLDDTEDIDESARAVR